MPKTPTLRDLVDSYNAADTAHSAAQAARRRQIETLQVGPLAEIMAVLDTLSPEIERLRPLVEQLTDHRANHLAGVLATYDNTRQVLFGEAERIAAEAQAEAERVEAERLAAEAAVAQ